MLNNTHRDNWIDYLRSSITVLVVAHHCSLAYTTFASFDANAYINSTHPVVDTQRWIGLDIFENFNDIFFMSLMFFIGGLFLTKSITKKGAAAFLKDRCFRLFLPFLFGVSVLMLLAYFPAYYLAHHDLNIPAYIKDFFTTEQWPVGPPWFIWVLFAFNALFGLSWFLFKNVYIRAGKAIQRLASRPLLFFGLFIGITWITYVPLTAAIGAGTWTGIGPFDFQLNRILLYFAYFILGVITGSGNFQQGLFSRDAALTRHWKVWCILALIAYTLITLNGIYEPLRNMVIKGMLPPLAAWMIYFTVYVSSCTLSCIAFLTAFRAKINHTNAWMDSLTANAYMIYLVHYIFVLWTQFILLPLHAPAGIKFLLSFSGTLLLSWGLSIILRKIKVVRQYI